MVEAGTRLAPTKSPPKSTVALLMLGVKAMPRHREALLPKPVPQLLCSGACWVGLEVGRVGREAGLGPGHQRQESR